MIISFYFGTQAISIHSLRMEGDKKYTSFCFLLLQFQSTPSVWRETVVSISSIKTLLFQSTPSVWRETNCFLCQCCYINISIHSLRMEGDPLNLYDFVTVTAFQSTPSVWRETYQIFPVLLTTVFQSTPSVWRETLLYLCMSLYFLHFNPLPPYGGRHAVLFASFQAFIFQSTPSVWRETCLLCSAGFNY